jgi:hypothetical protein
MFFRGDRRTAHVEEPAWTNLIQFNEPAPRRTAAQRTFAPSRMVPRGKEHAASSTRGSSAPVAALAVGGR